MHHLVQFGPEILIEEPTFHPPAAPLKHWLQYIASSPCVYCAWICLTPECCKRYFHSRMTRITRFVFTTWRCIQCWWTLCGYSMWDLITLAFNTIAGFMCVCLCGLVIECVFNCDMCVFALAFCLTIVLNPAAVQPAHLLSYMFALSSTIAQTAESIKTIFASLHFMCFVFRVPPLVCLLSTRMEVICAALVWRFGTLYRWDILQN